MHLAKIPIAFACTSLLASSAMAQLLYDVTPLGLTDAEHQRSDGRVDSTRYYYNESGDAAGRSSRYSGMTYKGASAWAYDGTQVHRIGLFDAEHTRSDGYRFSDPRGINEVGDVLGTSQQYIGTNENRSAWIFTNGQTHRLGFLDARHTATDGRRSSYGYQLNEAGQAIGYSKQYDGNSIGGTTAWISIGSQIQPIGRLTPNGFNAQGFSGSEPEYLNEAGQATGYAALYNDAKVYLGNTAWLYENGVTIDIGLEDALHLGTGGKVESRSHGISAGGDVIGTSTRYSGSSTAGKSAWIRPYGEPTKAIGLYTGVHQRSDGRVNNGATKINALGQAAGWASNYVGAGEGTSAWFYDGTTTTEMGLLDAEHTRTNGTRSSEVNIMNDSGTLAGLTFQRATRTVGQSTESGLSAYMYRDGETRRIGLLDGVHVLPGDFSSNVVRHINEAGQITGVATRFGGATSPSIGATSWFYDPETNITHPLEFSVSTSGRASSAVSFLSETGACLGEYVPYIGESPQGYHAFFWSLDLGFHDLGPLGGTGFVGWDNIYDAIVINGFGDAMATGQINQDLGFQSSFDLPSNVWGTLPVLLTPTPEPTTLGFLGAIGVIALRRRCC